MDRIEGFKEGYSEGYEIGQADKRKKIIGLIEEMGDNPDKFLKNSNLDFPDGVAEQDGFLWALEILKQKLKDGDPD